MMVREEFLKKDKSRSINVVNEYHFTIHIMNAMQIKSNQIKYPIAGLRIRKIPDNWVRFLEGPQVYSLVESNWPSYTPT